MQAFRSPRQWPSCSLERATKGGIVPPAPAPLVLSYGHVRLRPVQLGDAGLLAELWSHGENSLLAVPDQASEGIGEAMIRAFQQTMWGAAFVAEGGADSFGFLAAAQADPYSQTAMLVAYFRDPDSAQYALRLYLRHLFWGYPLHRIGVQVPLACSGYLRVLDSVGFVREGIWREHRLIAGVRHDVVALGLLREEARANLQTVAPEIAW
jgi:diamine N-acetyltransferase